MPDWPLRGDGQQIEAVGVVGASSRGTAISSGIAEGTSSAIGSGTPGTLTDSTKSWETNEWAGYSVVADDKLIVVASNTGTVLTGDAAWTSSAPTSPVAYVLSKIHAKGDWTQIVAATSYSAQGILVSVQQVNDLLALLDIGIGAEGSEVVLIPNLYLDFSVSVVAGVGWCFSSYIPIAVPAGSRLSARVQDSGQGGMDIYVHLQLMSQGFLPSQPFSRCSAYGIVTASSRGTEIDPGATSNTKGDWVQFDADVDQDIRAILMEVGAGGTAKSAGKRSWLVDVGIGADGSEVVIVPDLLFGSDNFLDNIAPVSVGPLPCHIPKGSRLAVRCQHSYNTATERLIYVALHGMD